LPTETRYFKNATIENNGLSCKELGTSQSTTYAQYYTYTIDSGVAVYFGIRVWKRSSAGVETEITAGTPVAQVSRSVNGEGIQSNMWSCPQTALASGDSIVVRAYRKHGSGSWTQLDSWQTEDIDGSQLDAANWTVYYWTKRNYVAGDPSYTESWFRFGSSTYNSRIEGFAYTGAPTYYKTLAVTEVSVASLAKTAAYYRTLAVIELSVVALAKAASYYRTLAATCTSVVSLLKVATRYVALAVTSLTKPVLKAAVIEPLRPFVEGENCFVMEHIEDWRGIVTMVTLKGGKDGSGNDIVVTVQDKDAIKKYGTRLMIVSETQWTSNLLCQLRALQILSNFSKPTVTVKLDCGPNIVKINEAVSFKSTNLGVDDTFNVQSVTHEYGEGEKMVLELGNRPLALTDLFSTLERLIQRR